MHPTAIVPAPHKTLLKLQHGYITFPGWDKIPTLTDFLTMYDKFREQPQRAIQETETYIIFLTNENNNLNIHVHTNMKLREELLVKKKHL